ncbi:fasciclin-like arabinogalactan protein 19 [Vigna umbellata]|uniref:fasciclin-like arabinogalactan protein 19 n=1 Tax=Vigna umbellata TaxID=87088 RepID=UPI001F5FE553|nr:fasciclin-like arabinogalactan protein 19 [Vigna umbellata]
MWRRLGGVWVRCIVVAILLKAVSVRCKPTREFDSMLSTVRARGYDLFCNAIVTSDLQMDILSHQNDNNATSRAFTFFAPTDASLFALDMTQTASTYTDTLRFHVVPRRLSLAHLRLLPDGYTLPTLLPQRLLQLTRRNTSAIAVGGVDVAFPGLYYGHYFAVHGLAGILSPRSNVYPSPSPSPSPSQFAPPVRSRSSPNSPANQPVLAPVPNFASLRVPPVEAPASATSPVGSSEEESEWKGYTPAGLPPRYPGSAISQPPEGYSDALASAPAPEALEGMRRCLNPVVGLEESDMQCHSA